MTDIQTRSLLTLYVAWHPSFTDGAGVAKALRAHFRRDLFGSVAGGTGLSVLFRSELADGAEVPLNVDAADAETTAIIVLADPHLAQDTKWADHVGGLWELADQRCLTMRVGVVTLVRQSGSSLPEREHRRFALA